MSPVDGRTVRRRKGRNMDGTKNLTVPRGDKSVWDKPRLGAPWANYDQERWLQAAWGSGLAMIGARRGGFSGGLVAMLGSIMAIRAAMGRHDLHVARRWLENTLTDRGWGTKDIVADASEESFPASDSPSWTAASGATPNK
jgi:hypothetical protein